MIKKTVYSIFTLLLLAASLQAAIAVGNLAPDFTLNTIDGNEFTLSDSEGSIVLLYFLGYN